MSSRVRCVSTALVAFRNAHLDDAIPNEYMTIEDVRHNYYLVFRLACQHLRLDIVEYLTETFNLPSDDISELVNYLFRSVCRLSVDGKDSLELAQYLNNHYHIFNSKHHTELVVNSLLRDVSDTEMINWLKSLISENCTI